MHIIGCVVYDTNPFNWRSVYIGPGNRSSSEHSPQSIIASSSALAKRFIGARHQLESASRVRITSDGYRFIIEIIEIYLQSRPGIFNLTSLPNEQDDTLPNGRFRSFGFYYIAYEVNDFLFLIHFDRARKKKKI